MCEYLFISKNGKTGKNKQNTILIITYISKKFNAFWEENILNGVRIVGTGSYKPKNVVKNDDFKKIIETSDGTGSA